MNLVSWDMEVLTLLSSTVQTKLARCGRKSAAIHEVSSCFPLTTENTLSVMHPTEPLIAEVLTTLSVEEQFVLHANSH